METKINQLLSTYTYSKAISRIRAVASNSQVADMDLSAKFYEYATEGISDLEKVVKNLEKSVKKDSDKRYTKAAASLEDILKSKGKIDDTTFATELRLWYYLFSRMPADAEIKRFRREFILKQMSNTLSKIHDKAQFHLKAEEAINFALTKLAEEKDQKVSVDTDPLDHVVTVLMGLPGFAVSGDDSFYLAHLTPIYVKEYEFKIAKLETSLKAAETDRERFLQEQKKEQIENEIKLKVEQERAIEEMKKREEEKKLEELREQVKQNLLSEQESHKTKRESAPVMPGHGRYGYNNGGYGYNPYPMYPGPIHQR